MKRLHRPRLAIPPGWTLRRDNTYLYLSYRGWAVARFSAAQPFKRVTREILWHIAVLSALKEGIARLN